MQSVVNEPKANWVPLTEYPEGASPARVSVLFLLFPNFRASDLQLTKMSFPAYGLFKSICFSGHFRLILAKGPPVGPVTRFRPAQVLHER